MEAARGLVRKSAILFNSYVFIIFAAIVFGLYFLNFGWRWKKLFLLLMSYIFYAAWNAPYLLLIIFSTVLDYIAGGRMEAAKNQRTKRFWLGLSLLGNLGVLSYFKYGEFAVQNFALLLSTVGIHYEPLPWSILLPVGISFYTFQTLSYTIDIYKGRLKHTESFLDFALFVTFFPQLVAGPIVRARRFIPQLTAPRNVSLETFGTGLILIIIGLFQKVAVADGFLAPVVDRVFATEGTLPTLSVIMACYAFAIQILCDFGGYSLIAIGVARCLGFQLPENFRAPFVSVGFRDFWQRWHVSMSSWFRDYLYANIRNRNDRSIKGIIIAQIITMTIIGLWHGAAWTFVVWGLFNGLVLGTELFLRDKLGHQKFWHGRVMTVFFALLTFSIMAFSSILFRSQSLAQSRDLFQSFYRPAETALNLSMMEIATVTLIVVATLGCHAVLRQHKLEEVVRRAPPVVLVFTLAAMMMAAALAGGTNAAFIYFQF